MWINAKTERLPEIYDDVIIELTDGTKHIARLNVNGGFSKASYQKTKYGYGIKLEDVAFWFDVPERA